MKCLLSWRVVSLQLKYVYTSEGKRSTGPHIRKLNLFNGFLNWVCFAVDTPSKYLCRFPQKISIKQSSNALITLMKSFPKLFLKDVTCPWIGSQLFKIPLPKCYSDLLLWFFSQKVMKIEYGSSELVVTHTTCFTAYCFFATFSKCIFCWLTFVAILQPSVHLLIA